MGCVLWLAEEDASQRGSGGTEECKRKRRQHYLQKGMDFRELEKYMAYLCTYQTSPLSYSWVKLTVFQVSIEELRAHPFTEVTCSCHFSFVEGTENLEFSWEREDIQEEYEFMDEAIYKCSAITPHGRGESPVKLIVEDSEMPQVQFDRIDDEDVATCISKGWYLVPKVTWLDRAERDLSNHSTVEILEEQMSGFYSVSSVLKYPVKLNEKYICRITETDVNNRPFRIIRKYPNE